MRTRRVLLTALLAVVLAPVATSASASASSSSADGDRIGFSRDGVSWAARLGAPLFDPDVRWVPGDSRTSTFYVRNQAADDGDLTVDVLGARVDSLLESGGLTILARADAGEWRAVSRSGTRRLLSSVESADGGVTRLDVRVDFDPTSRNVSQTLALDLVFRVRLVEAAAAGRRDLYPSRPGGGLPDTGGPASWVLVLGLVLTGAGSVQVSRRRSQEDIHA